MLAAVTNLTVANMNLTIQVEKCANHLTTKEFVMTSMQKKQPVAGGNEKTKNQAVWPDHQENRLKTAQEEICQLVDCSILLGAWIRPL